MEHQPRITDFIPRRPLTLLMLLALNLVVIGGLEWLYFKMPTWARQTTDGRVATFDLDSEGSLGAWYSSTVLAVAAAFAFLVYSLRRHRIDDYRGRYRTWFAAGLCFAMMSIDESASLHEGFKEMMSLLTGHRLYGDGSLWWVAGYGLVLGWVGFRLLLDMRECWSATLAFLATGACFAVAVLTQLEILLPQRGAVGVMLEEGLEMLGNVMLWLACTLYARYLVRDIEGLIPHAKRKRGGEEASSAEAKPKRRRKVAAEAAATETSSPTRGRRTVREPAEAKTSTANKSATADSAASARIAKPASTVAKAEEARTALSSSKAAVASNPGETRIDDAEELGGPKLSKADRRAMRKERRKNR